MATTITFLCLQSQASDALALPGEDGELTSALRELSALMKGLAEEPAMESPAHRRALLRTSLPASLKAVLGQTYAGEADSVAFSVQEALESVARALAKVRAGGERAPGGVVVCCCCDGGSGARGGCCYFVCTRTRPAHCVEVRRGSRGRVLHALHHASS